MECNYCDSELKSVQINQLSELTSDEAAGEEVRETVCEKEQACDMNRVVPRLDAIMWLEQAP